MHNGEMARNSSIRVLIVEDSQTQAERLKYLLEQNKYRTTVACNGKEGLSLLRKERMDIVISDIMMPEMDGYELCRQIKADKALEDIPVILLTALSDPKDVLNGLQCGADNFVTKPYDERYLRSRIDFLLANLRLREESRIQVGVEIIFEGQKYFITSERQQILNLLLSTYETAIEKNKELIRVQEELKALNDQLEERVLERTASLVAEMEERRKAEEERAKLEQQLLQAQKMEAVGQLAGGIAHDFNNILSAIVGYGSLLQMKMKAGDPMGANVDGILQAADRAACLTHSLLAFSRKQIMSVRPVSLNEIIGRVKGFLGRIIGEDIELGIRLCEGDPTVMADSGQIEQVLMNLATNARDAMPGGGVLSIETQKIGLDDEFVRVHGYGKPGDYALISVADTGSGMDEETRKKIFEPFFTTKDIGKGTGLGLSVVYGIIKQHDGYINVYSEPGAGTAFKIFLPAVADRAEAPREPVDAPSLIGGHETILVAEDDAQLRILTESILSEFGYKVITAENGEDAVSRFMENDGDIRLCLLDLIMPKKSGKEAYDAIRSIRPDVRVLFLSGYTAEVVIKKGILENGLEYVLKPVSPRDLLRRVREVLDR